MSDNSTQAELEQAAADFDRAMDAIVDAATTVDLLQALYEARPRPHGAEPKPLELGTDDEHAAGNALRAVQRHLKRAREALERGAG